MELLRCRELVEVVATPKAALVSYFVTAPNGINKNNHPALSIEVFNNC
jgi:hypothetical protein